MSPDVEMTFMEHLEELRKRILYCIYAVLPATFVSFSFARPLLEAVTFHARSLPPEARGITRVPIEIGFSPVLGPFLSYRLDAHRETILQTLAPTETVVCLMKVAFVAAIFLVFPFIMFQVWKFVEPGLKETEKKFLGPFLLSSWIFFIIGGLFGYLIMLKLAVPMLASFGHGIAVDNWSLANYVSFVLRILLVFGVIFEMPVIAALLSMLGILTPAFLRHYRRYAILFNFIIAAILTPPDPVTMVIMVIPLLGLYELSIFVSYFFQRKPITVPAPTKSSG